MNRNFKRNIKYLIRGTLLTLWGALCTIVWCLASFAAKCLVMYCIERFVESEMVIFVCNLTVTGVFVVYIYIKGLKIYEKVYDKIDDFIRM